MSSVSLTLRGCWGQGEHLRPSLLFIIIAFQKKEVNLASEVCNALEVSPLSPLYIDEAGLRGCDGDDDGNDDIETVWIWDTTNGQGNDWGEGRAWHCGCGTETVGYSSSTHEGGTLFIVLFDSGGHITAQ